METGSEGKKASSPMPALFVGHGNPLNAVTENRWSLGWRELGRALPRPRAVLSVSAHWYIGESAVTAMERPPTIHDFGGFPEELYEVSYPAPGDPGLAGRVAQLVGPDAVRLDGEWGLDHGTWSVLRSMFPDAGVPVVQLAIDATRPPAFHREVGRRLGALRDEGVLVLGSGNIVHNLHAYSWGQREAAYDWALRFEALARSLLVAGEDERLADHRSLGSDARLAVPTPDHYLPLLYVLGTRRPEDEVTFPVEGIDGGSVSMLAVQLG